MLPGTLLLDEGQTVGLEKRMGEDCFHLCMQFFFNSCLDQIGMMYGFKARFPE